MGGYCFFIDDKMCVELDIDKKTNKDRPLARIGEDVMQEALSKKGCKRMDITGKPMKGFVFVEPSGFKLDCHIPLGISIIWKRLDPVSSIATLSISFICSEVTAGIITPFSVINSKKSLSIL